MKERSVVKVFNVKDVEVEILSDNKLRFMKNDELVEIERDSFLGDYRKVYNFLKSKTNRNQDSFKEVGNFLYKVENDILVIKRKNDDEILDEINVKDEDIKYLRNYVINYLINNL